MRTSLFTGLALSESENVVARYICHIHSANHTKTPYSFAFWRAGLKGGFTSVLGSLREGEIFTSAR